MVRDQKREETGGRNERGNQTYKQTHALLKDGKWKKRQREKQKKYKQADTGKEMEHRE